MISVRHAADFKLPHFDRFTSACFGHKTGSFVISADSTFKLVMWSLETMEPVVRSA